VVPRIFIITTVKFKELKINIEVEEIHPTTGIKNAGMEKKMVQRSLLQYPEIIVIVVVTTYTRKNKD